VDSTFALDLLPDDRTFVNADGRWVSIWEVTAANRPFSHTNFTVAFPLERLGELAPEHFVAGTIDPRAVRRSAFAFPPKGDAFLISDEHGSLAHWDSRLVQPTQTLRGLGSNHWGLAFSTEGRWLAAGEAGGDLTVWDWPAQRAVTNFTMPVELIGTVRFSQTGQFLHATAVNNQGEFKTRLWRTADWSEIPLNGSQFDGLSAIAISPDERMLAGGFRDGAVKLFRFPLGKPEPAMKHDKLVSGVYFSKDDRQLISASWDCRVIVWDVPGRRKLATLQGPGYVWGAALSSNNGRLATGGHGPGNAVVLWDLSARQPLLSLPGNGRFFFHIAFSPDENTLVAISMSGTAELWRAPSWAEIEAAEHRR
jgi:WD40 repeat protein